MLVLDKQKYKELPAPSPMPPLATPRLSFCAKSATSFQWIIFAHFSSCLVRLVALRRSSTPSLCPSDLAPSLSNRRVNTKNPFIAARDPSKPAIWFTSNRFRECWISIVVPTLIPLVLAFIVRTWISSIGFPLRQAHCQCRPTIH